MAKRLSLASYIASGMVIQQQLPFILKGTAREDAKIQLILEKSPADGRPVSPLDKEYGIILEDSFKTDPQGRFVYEIAPQEASFDSYSLQLQCGAQTLVLEDLLVGEVWLGAGQSDLNREMCHGLSDRQIADYANSNYIRFLLQSEDGLEQKKKTYNSKPCISLSMARWLNGSDAQAIRQVPALDFYFAKELQLELKVPVAIVETSMSSTFIHSWISRDTIDNHEHIRHQIEKYGFYRDDSTWNMAGDWGHHLPGALYNHKIAPLQDLAIRGIIWHQGDKDHTAPEYYRSALKYMMQDWQKVFRTPASTAKTPVTAGLNLAEQLDGLQDNSCCAWIFIQQRPVIFDDDHTGLLLAEYCEALTRTLYQSKCKSSLLPSYDLYESEDKTGKTWYAGDFPVRIEMMARKLRRSAQGLVYQSKASPSAPECSGIELVGSKLLLSFCNTGEGLRALDSGGRVRGFSICGPDRVFREAQARILYGVRLLVWHDQIDQPQAVAYAYASMNISANLVNSDWLPVVPFRSDRERSIYHLPIEWSHCDTLAEWSYPYRQPAFSRPGQIAVPQILPVWNITPDTAKISLEHANKQEGDASIFVQYKQNFEEPVFKLKPRLEAASDFPPLNLQHYTHISIDLFNPDRQMKNILLRLQTDEAGDQSFASSQVLVMAALRWQTITFSIDDILDSHQGGRNIYQLCFEIFDKKAAGSLYVDNIRFLANH